MPSFDVQWTRGVTVEPFADPNYTPVGQTDKWKAGRLNPRQNIPPRHAVTRPRTFVQLKAVVDGVVGPADADIVGPAGPKFLCSIIEYGGTVLPRLHTPFARSSVQSFWARAPGHYTVRMIRLGGKGTVILHLSCERSI